MPERSNDFQKVVFLIQQNLAGESTVRESAFLVDRLTGDRHEVDVVIDTVVHGHNLVISFESRSWQRRQEVGWVNQMHSKHESLPTDRLVLVSSSGFTEGAKKKAAVCGIELVDPFNLTDGDAQAIAERVDGLRLKTIKLKIIEVVARPVHVDGLPDLPAFAHDPTDDTHLFSKDHVFLGTLCGFASGRMSGIEDMSSVMMEATPEHKAAVFTDDDPHYTIDGSDEQHRFYLETLNTLTLREISLIDIACEVEVVDVGLSLEHGHVPGTDFSWARVPAFDHHALVVVTHTPEGTNKLSVLDLDSAAPGNIHPRPKGAQ